MTDFRPEAALSAMIMAASRADLSNPLPARSEKFCAIGPLNPQKKCDIISFSA